MKTFRNLPPYFQLLKLLNLQCLVDSGHCVQLLLNGTNKGPKIPSAEDIEQVIQNHVTQACNALQDIDLSLVTRRKKVDANSSIKPGIVLALAARFDTIRKVKIQDVQSVIQQEEMLTELYAYLSEDLPVEPTGIIKNLAGYVALFVLKKPVEADHIPFLQGKIAGLYSLNLDYQGPSANVWPLCIPLNEVRVGGAAMQYCELLEIHPERRYSLENFPDGEVECSLQLKDSKSNGAKGQADRGGKDVPLTIEEHTESILVAPNKPALRKHQNRLPEVKNKARQKDPPFYIKDGHVWKAPEGDEDKPVQICRRLEIVEIHQDIDTQSVSLEIAYDYKGREYTREIPRHMLTRAKLLSLLEYGMDVPDDLAVMKLLLRYLRYADEQAPLVNSHDQLGFSELDGTLIYKLYQAVGCKSTYVGPLEMEPKGTMENWFEVIKQDVIGYIPLEFALTMGLAAPVASLLTRARATDVQIVHMCGDSTMGKTTASALAVSPFGSPNSKENGLLQTWNATENAIFGRLRGVHGVPFVLDEASIKGSDNDFSSMVYVVASGKEKARMDSSGKMSQQNTWSGLFISNAEHSLKSNSKQNTGIELRLFELSGIKWTKSAEHADLLKKGILDNYGHAGPVFVAHLIQTGIAEIIRRHGQWRDAFRDKLQHPDKFAERIADKMATFLLTAELSNQALGLGLNIEGIMNFLQETVDTRGEDRDVGFRAYDYFREAVIRYRANFSDEKYSQEAFEHWGMLRHNRRGQLKEIVILVGKFKEIMKAGGFEDPEVILGDWRKRGWLSCDKGKFTRKRVIATGEETRTYVIKPTCEIRPVVAEGEFDDECIVASIPHVSHLKNSKGGVARA